MARSIMLLGLVLGLSLGVAGQQAQAQEHTLPTGAGRVVKKVQLMALTGKSEIDWTISRIMENNAELIPGP